jgi:hypothetical protein
MNGEEEDAMAAVLKHLKQAVAALEGVVPNGEEEEDGEEEGENLREGEEDEDESEENEESADAESGEEMSTEAVDAEVIGTALTQLNKLLGGLTSTSNKVQGAVPSSKGKAVVKKGQTTKGHPEPFNTNPETLTKTDNKVGTVNKVGKSIFEQ